MSSITGVILHTNRDGMKTPRGCTFLLQHHASIFQRFLVCTEIGAEVLMFAYVGEVNILTKTLIVATVWDCPSININDTEGTFLIGRNWRDLFRIHVQGNNTTAKTVNVRDWKCRRCLQKFRTEN
jgi:hypothetical protein